MGSQHQQSPPRTARRAAPARAAYRAERIGWTGVFSWSEGFTVLMVAGFWWVGVA